MRKPKASDNSHTPGVRPRNRLGRAAIPTELPEQPRAKRPPGKGGQLLILWHVHRSDARGCRTIATDAQTSSSRSTCLPGLRPDQPNRPTSSIRADVPCPLQYKYAHVHRQLAPAASNVEREHVQMMDDRDTEVVEMERLEFRTDVGRLTTAEVACGPSDSTSYSHCISNSITCPAEGKTVQCPRFLYVGVASMLQMCPR